MQQIIFIREVYQVERVSQIELTKDFNTFFKTNLSVQQIKACLQRNKIKTRRKCGCKKGQIHTGQFQKGYKPKPNSGQFKKGYTPWNKKGINMKFKEHWIVRSNMSQEFIYNKFKKMIEKDTKLKDIANAFDITVDQAKNFAKRHFEYQPKKNIKPWSDYPFYMGSDKKTLNMLKTMFIDQDMTVVEMAEALDVEVRLMKIAVHSKAKLRKGKKEQLDEHLTYDRDEDNILFSTVVIGAKREALNRLC
jgi:hypothetical protein